jgi:aminoglycoside phosphotransferase (APT) family kinase protein
LLVSIRGIPLAAEDGDAAAELTKLRARALRHEAAGFPAVDAFLDRHLPATPRAAFVHFDLHTGNLMLGREGGELRVTGVLDFVASRAFYPAFDLVTPGVYFALGDPALLGAMSRTAGLGAVGPEELAAWHLLHPFSDLRRDLRMAGRAAAAPDLERAVVDLWISR